MQRRQLMALLAGGLPAAMAGCQEASPDDTDEPVEPTEPDEWPAGTFAAEYETTTVTVAGDGTVRGEVRAAIPATQPEIELGLTPADSLPSGGGMLFVYDESATRSHNMQDMSFGVDYIFADSSREITAIHSAPAPDPGEDGAEQEYTGEGQYVLVVNHEWTDENSVTAEDRLEFDPAP